MEETIGQALHLERASGHRIEEVGHLGPSQVVTKHGEPAGSMVRLHNAGEYFGKIAHVVHEVAGQSAAAATCLTAAIWLCPLRSR